MDGVLFSVVGVTGLDVSFVVDRYRDPIPSSGFFDVAVPVVPAVEDAPVRYVPPENVGRYVCGFIEQKRGAFVASAAAPAVVAPSSRDVPS